jgi:hypothetical protein
VQHAVGLQLLEHAPGHLARAADQARQLLPGHADLGALRVAHRLGLLAQVVQGADDAVGDVQEGQARLALRLVSSSRRRAARRSRRGSSGIVASEPANSWYRRS